jgi:predicted GH43/DUF377 family glycosyl hydrolase
VTVPSIVSQEIGHDPTRVVTRLFVAGREDVGPGDSRAGVVIERIMALPEAEVVALLADLEQRFAGRHRDLRATFLRHADLVMSRVGATVGLTLERTLVLGAAFTHEYAIEGAALCNPSVVVHPVQPDPSMVEFVMSVRGVGEGHRSSIGFRNGRLLADGTAVVDPPGPFPTLGETTPGVHLRSVFRSRLAESDDHENAAYVLDSVAERFDGAALDARIDGLAAEVATRRRTATTIGQLRDLAASSYVTTFSAGVSLSERVLWPVSPAEQHGMEDARFVRFTDDDGVVTYLGTYTAFDGTNIAQHLLSTTDFVSFAANPLAGAAAVGKGLALFPRKVRGRFCALSRADRVSNAIAFSDDMHLWPESESIQMPQEGWEILQLGNCGSPIETGEGWLVLTHGVGPMRTYSIGALLLDLHEPRIVLARTREPLIVPGTADRDGYVPNVVYTCGGFAHGDVLVLPYGRSDQRIAVATMSIDAILRAMTRETTATTTQR